MESGPVREPFSVALQRRLRTPSAPTSNKPIVPGYKGQEREYSEDNRSERKGSACYTDRVMVEWLLSNLASVR